MKILIAASNMVHINNFHRSYINEFREAGHDVYIMASGEGADFNIPFKKRSLSIKNLRLSSKIKKIIKKEQFDVVYLHTTLAAFWIRFALKGIKKRPIVVNTVHGYLFGKGFSSLHNKIYLSCEKMMRNITDHIVVMNDEDFKIAKDNSLSLGEIYRINGMGIDFSKKNIERASPQYPPKNLIYVGELNKRKNQIFLVKAMKRLPDMHLTLVGDGKERKAIEKYIKKERLEERVKITGFTKNVGEYLKNADLYVSASTIEGLPFNILEAMQAGLPVVASNIKGQNDILPNESLYELSSIDSYVSLVNSKLKADYDLSKYTSSVALRENMDIYSLCTGNLVYAEKQI
ncbi:MAG: glycosyltransferase [Clostridia bacterium]|nr:glycosyltransferase [Clostridia bacterium]